MNTESALISAICQNKDIEVLLADNAEELFSSHKDVWEGLKSYYYKYRSVPEVGVLQDRFRDFTPTTTTAKTEYYLDQLKTEYLNGKLKSMLLRAGSDMREESPARVMQRMQTELTSLNKFTNSVRDIDVTDIDLAEKHFDAVRARSLEMGGSPGILTGIKAVDTAYPTGMAPGHLIVAIGWPGRGKTFLTSYLAIKAWEQGFRPMIMSLEMSPEDLRNRIYALMGSGMFRISDFQRGSVNIDDFSAWGRKKFVDKHSFIIVSSDGASEVTPMTVQAKIDQHRPNLVICDYHQLFNDNKRSNSEVERNRNISREFKLMAVSNKIPIIDITAATMDDISDQDAPPMLSQVAWSKSIEYDADMAMAIHRHTDTDLIEVVSRKNRHGRDFSFYLDIDLDRGIMQETYGDN